MGNKCCCQHRRSEGEDAQSERDQQRCFNFSGAAIFPPQNRAVKTRGFRGLDRRESGTSKRHYNSPRIPKFPAGSAARDRLQAVLWAGFLEMFLMNKKGPARGRPRFLEITVRRKVSNLATFGPSGSSRERWPYRRPDGYDPYRRTRRQAW
jgi:hypothetical protein